MTLVVFPLCPALSVGSLPKQSCHLPNTRRAQWINSGRVTALRPQSDQDAENDQYRSDDRVRKKPGYRESDTDHGHTCTERGPCHGRKATGTAAAEQRKCLTSRATIRPWP